MTARPIMVRDAGTPEPVTCPACGHGFDPMAGRVVRAPRDVAEHVADMARLDREHLRVLILDSRNRVRSAPTVYMGNVSAALVRVGELFTEPLRRNAASIILAHNHPSGDPTPSPDDLHLTAEAVAAGRLLDLPVRDHVIVGAAGSYVSLRDRGIPFDREAFR